MATTPSVADLVDRIHRLEQSAHRWRLGAIGLGLLLATGAAGPDAPAVVPEVRTRKLLLVDDRDRPCAVLQYAAGKACGLEFADPDNPRNITALFGWGADGSGLMQVNTRDGRNVAQHTGLVNDKGVPLERVQQALEQMRRAATP